MGRYSSDSDDEKKKRKKKKKRRSRSRSKSLESIDSRHSSKQKKSKKKKKRRSRSHSRSPERRRSRSYDRRRSRSRERYRKRSRSVSRGRYSRSRSRDRRRRRSRSYDSHSRSARRSRSRSLGNRRSKRDRDSTEREDPCLNIPGFAEMAPSEQAKIRMNMALKAAAAADEKIKGDTQRISSATSLQDSMAFSQAIQDIESTGFSAATFKSSRGDHKDGSTDRDEFVFGTAGELRLDSHRKPVILDIDKEDLAHPSLYSDPEERMERWVQRLTQLRRKKLEGEALA
ncbi:serine/Arginine-related protein 53-like [Mya arenaria]|uniref:serine/Arginine-related protein 53-like n=1 Tax=Mya arenaria TaxID=6604 RepID=UPI0022E0B040|nr:serine/Arginine-related protein 53-like [Mya arenaria]